MGETGRFTCFRSAAYGEAERALAEAPRPRRDYKAAVRSVVWIQKLDGRGQRINIGSGFVLKPGEVLTAFQVIDGASNLRVVLPDGRSVDTKRAHILEPAAGLGHIVKVETGAAAPLHACLPQAAPAVGERVTFLNVEGENTRVIVSAHLVDEEATQKLGRAPFIVSTQDVASGVGGWTGVVNDYGEVIGVIGVQCFARHGVLSARGPPAWQSGRVLHGNGAATPIALVPRFGSGKTHDSGRTRQVGRTHTSDGSNGQYHLRRHDESDRQKRSRGIQRTRM